MMRPAAPDCRMRKIHFSRTRSIGVHEMTGMLCGISVKHRTQSDNEIACSSDIAEVTCKHCLAELDAQIVRRAA
jgi:hypothetical protein